MIKGGVMYLIESTWRNMLSRCRSAAVQEDEWTVCEVWKNDYKAFRKWFIDNIYNCNGESLVLDRNLFSGDLKIYSPETCCMLPRRIADLLKSSRKKSDGLPSGIYLSKSKKYTAIIHRGSGHLSKTFDELNDAVDFYNSNKQRHIREYAEYYRPYLPERTYTALMKYEVG